MKKILYLNQFGQIGGAEVSLQTIIKNINKGVFEPVLACGKGPLVEEVRKIGVKVIELEFPSFKMFFSPKFVAGIRQFYCLIGKINKLIRQEDTKLIHANTLQTAFIGGICGRINRIPVIWHVRDFLEGVSFRSFFIVATQRLVSCIITNSKAVSRIFKDKRKVKVIYNSIDMTPYQNSEKKDVRQEFSISKEAFVLVSVGRLHPEKGFGYLIRSLPLIVKTFPQTYLLIVGDASLGSKKYEEDLRELAKELGLGGHVILTGFRKDVPDIIKNSNLFVLPSIKEPFGLVTLEAMAASKPVVATKTGGTMEVVGETAILVEPEDSAQLSEAIIKVMRDSELAEEMGRKGRQRAEEQFSLEKLITSIGETYKQLLKER